MKHNFISHRLPGFLALLFVMTMILCSLYVPVSAAESDPTVSGVWIFDFDTYPSGFTTGVNAPSLTFTSDGQTFSRMYMGTGDVSFYGSGSYPTVACDKNGWRNPNFKTVDFGETPQTVPADFYERLIAVATRRPDPVHLLQVFSFFASSIVPLVSSLILLFYSSETGLTFLGVLAVAALAISVALLIFTLISRWLKLRG